MQHSQRPAAQQACIRTSTRVPLELHTSAWVMLKHETQLQPRTSQHSRELVCPAYGWMGTKLKWTPKAEGLGCRRPSELSRDLGGQRALASWLTSCQRCRKPPSARRRDVERGGSLHFGHEAKVLRLEALGARRSLDHLNAPKIPNTLDALHQKPSSGALVPEFRGWGLSSIHPC